MNSRGDVTFAASRRLSRTYIEEVARRYADIANAAIDPLVLEKTSHLTVVQAGFPWSDLGSWADLMAARRDTADLHGNVAFNSTD